MFQSSSGGRPAAAAAGSRLKAAGPAAAQVADRLLQVHLALARRSTREDVGHLDDRRGPAADQQLQADLEAAGRDPHPAREVAPDQEESGRRVAHRRQRRAPSGRPAATSAPRGTSPSCACRRRECSGCRSRCPRSRAASPRASAAAAPADGSRSASMTPTTGALAASNPSTTAVPSPSLPARWRTVMR